MRAFPLFWLLPLSALGGCAIPAYRKGPWRSGFPLPRAEATLAALRDPYGPPLVIAHRGGRAWAPENTVQGILAAWRMGAPLVEVDVRVTADGVPVLLHDSDLSRTTDRGGKVAARSLRAVRAARIPFRQAGPALRVPTLVEALRAARGKVVLVLDLKSVPIGVLLDTLKREGALEEVLVLAHKREQMEEIRARREGGKVLLAARARSSQEALRSQAAFRPAVVHVSPGFLSPALAARLRKGGSRVWVNALGAVDRAGRVEGYLDLLRRGADLIQTDRPLLALRALAALPAAAGG